MSGQILAVVGAGTMGRGIAQVAAQSGYRVLIHDSAPDAAAAARKRIIQTLESLAGKGKIDKDALQRAARNLAVAREPGELAEAEFIIEAVVEDRAVKQALFRQLDGLTQGRAVLASNTSSIPIAELADVTAHPEKVIGLHFMNPVPLMAGVEIVRAAKTSEDTWRAALALAESFGKIPIVCADRAGFVVNRMLMPLINEAALLVGEGVCGVEAADRAAVHCLNHPLGPLALSDLIGNDTTHHILAVIAGELGDRFRPAPLLTRMVQQGWLGNKSGAGFYLWRDNKPQGVNPALQHDLDGNKT